MENIQKNKLKTYYDMKMDFYKKFNNWIIPITKKYEARRKNYLIMAVIAYVIFLSLAANMIIPLIRAAGIIGASIHSLAILFIVGIGMPAGFQKFLARNLEHEIKKEIMPSVCKCIGDFNWSQGEYYNERLLAAAKIIADNYNGVRIDDVFTGRYRDVEIDIVEARYTRTTGSGKNRRTEVYFEGVFVALDINKKFNGNTVIRPDSFMKYDATGLKRTELEDVTFEKKYDVYTDDEIEARYLITPSFMERLNDMKTAFKTNKITCAFHDRKLIIGLTLLKDSFKLVSLTKSLDNREMYFQMFEEFLSIVKLIDNFKLNEKTGL